MLSHGPVSAVSLLTSADPIRLEPATTELPSRVAENLFWLGRYVERAEHVVRLLRSFIARLANQDTTDDPRQVSALLQVLVGLRVLPEELGKDTWLRKVEEDTRDLIARQSPHTGLRNALNEVRRLASVVRDRLSIDTWRILNLLQQDMRLRHGRIQFEEVLVHLNRIITDLAAFSGMEMENMTRGHGWRFLNLGRRLERSVNLVAVLRGALGVVHTADGAIVEPLLEIADSSMTYRRRYYAQPRLAPALHLLLADETNTRGLAFQLGVISEHITHLPRDPRAPSPTREERLIAHARDTLGQAEAIVSDAWSDDRPRDARRSARLDGRRLEGDVGRGHVFLLQPRGTEGELSVRWKAAEDRSAGDHEIRRRPWFSEKRVSWPPDLLQGVTVGRRPVNTESSNHYADTTSPTPPNTTTANRWSSRTTSLV